LRASSILVHWLLQVLIRRLPFLLVTRDSSVGIMSRYGLGSPGDQISVRARFSAPVQTGHGAHPTSKTMGTGVTMQARDVDYTHPYLESKFKKEYSYSYKWRPTRCNYFWFVYF
jgi:hypothetical protein